MIARRIVVHGRVQGVGFRDAMVDAAATAGATGWVRNRRDGTVEAWLQGEAHVVETAIAWARRGPSISRVDRVVVVDSAVNAAITGFRRAPTV